ncbi:hypothetical protein [Halotalea alkalilenta]|uniref:Type III secretion protein n=1 Tax=Halotalea alkalilenta TaxID=376489 RepID=A0A172YHL6_9GAMM|nr:hypothetical protein [Halotalea alkalilenta]ANF58744.1 hypothetical protein A5892_15760 [Halotalea alkalilenta]
MTVSRDAWQRLIESPTHWLAPEHLDALLGDIGDAQSRHRLCSLPRFQHRLNERIRARHKLTALHELPPPSAEELAVYRLVTKASDTLAHHCGAVCQARSLAQEIRAPRVNALKQSIGESCFTQALALIELARPNATELEDLERLGPLLEQDGHACLAAWFDTQPTPLRAWLALGSIAGVSAKEGRQDPWITMHGAEIVRRVAAAMANADRQTSDSERT